MSPIRANKVSQLLSDISYLKSQITTVQKAYDKQKKKFRKEIGYPSKSDIQKRIIECCLCRIDKQGFLKELQELHCSWSKDTTLPINTKPLDIVKQSFPYYRIDDVTVLTIHPRHGVIHIQHHGSLLQISALTQERFEDITINAKLFDYIRIKRVQRQVRKWLGLPRYPSGNKGFIFRKAEAEFNNLAT